VLIYLARRVLAVVPVLFGVTLAVFSMLFLVPGDPVKMMLAEFVTSPDQIAQMRAQLHLDEPLPQQYGRFVANALRGDLGTSIRSRRPVATEIAENVASTAQLALASMAVAVAIGVPLGLLAALFRNTWLDVGSMVVALLGVSMPSFWLGLLLIFVFSLHLAWWGVVGRHALKNALIPVITIFGLQFGNLLAGAVIVETVFSRPGLGRLIVGGILAKDFPLVQGTVLFVAASYVMINVIVDVAYAFVDRRIRVG